jgi:glycine cleavage system protein P-like pyridoxal-binding family
VRAGFDLAFPSRRATHEFIVTLKRQAKETGLTAMDVAKRLLDHGYHAPTTYFPLLVPECLLIEPTETESQETLDGFVAAMVSILEESQRRHRDHQGRAAPPAEPPLQRGGGGEAAGRGRDDGRGWLRPG